MECLVLVCYEPNRWLERVRQHDWALLSLSLLDRGLLGGVELSALFCVSKTVNALLRCAFECTTSRNQYLERIPLSLACAQVITTVLTYEPKEFPRPIEGPPPSQQNVHSIQRVVPEVLYSP
jgi:hypothetical protein